MHGLKKLIRPNKSNSVEVVYYTVTYLWGLMRRQTVHSVHIGGNAWVNPALNPARTVHGDMQTVHGWQFSVNRRQKHPASRPHRDYESRLAWVV